MPSRYSWVDSGVSGVNGDSGVSVDSGDSESPGTVGIAGPPRTRSY